MALEEGAAALRAGRMPGKRPSRWPGDWQTAISLWKLQDERTKLRRDVKTISGRIAVCEGELASSTQLADSGQVLGRVSSTPQQREKRDALLAKRMSDWSEVQVQEWIALIGLPSENVEIVQRALSADQTNGEDLEDLTQRKLRRLLEKAAADHPDDLATQTLKLHHAAHGEASAERSLVDAQAQLVAAREALRDNSVAIRDQTVELVSLACQHFPTVMNTALYRLRRFQSDNHHCALYVKKWSRGNIEPNYRQLPLTTQPAPVL